MWTGTSPISCFAASRRSDTNDGHFVIDHDGLAKTKLVAEAATLATASPLLRGLRAYGITRLISITCVFTETKASQKFCD